MYLRARERHSKRLRGEAVDKHIMFDDPELAARRKRQATLGESAARAASKQGRAVRFQQPLPCRTSPNGLAEEEALPDESSHMDEEEHLPAETPHNASIHSTLPPDSAGSGLNLTLSNSAAQHGSSELLDEEEEEGNQGKHGAVQHSATIVPVLAYPPLPPLNPHAVDPPDTTGKLLVKSKTSLEEAQSIAQGILGSGLTAPAIGANALPARSTGGFGAKPAAADSAASAAKKLPALSQQPREQRAVNGGSPPPAELIARETEPISSVLASTTRPNVPSKVGSNPAQLKPTPASASRLAHAGHTPYPLRPRMTPVDPHPNVSPHGSVGVMGVVRGVSKDAEGATPAATLRPFAGATPYPSINPSMPVEDTPMVDSGAVQHQIAPDSCVGQVSSETLVVTLWQ